MNQHRYPISTFDFNYFIVTNYNRNITETFLLINNVDLVFQAEKC